MSTSSATKTTPTATDHQHQPWPPRTTVVRLERRPGHARPAGPATRPDGRRTAYATHRHQFPPPPQRRPTTNHDDKAKPRRGRGDDGISWDKINKCYVGTVSLGYDATGKRIRRTVRGQDQGRGQGQARRLARRDQGGHPHAGDLHRRAMRPGLARLAHARPRDHRQLPGPGREMDLSEDRSGQAQGPQGDRGRTVLQRPRQGAQQAIPDDDQEHPAPVHPASPEARPDRPERRRTGRPPRGPARPAVPRHDPGTGGPGARPRPAATDRLHRVVKVGKYAPGRHPRRHRRRRTRVREQATQNATITDVSTDLADATCRSCRASSASTAPAPTKPGSRRCSSCAITLGLRPGELRALTLGSRRPRPRRSSTSGGRPGEDGDTKTPKSTPLPDAAQARRRGAQGAQEAPGRRTPRRRRGLARQRPGVLPRGRPPLHPRRAQLAVRQGHPAGRHRPLARPRRTPHRRVDHEQQRRAHPGHHRHAWATSPPTSPRPSTGT